VQIKTACAVSAPATVDLARRNAELSLASERTSHAAQRARAEALRDLLGLPALAGADRSASTSATRWARPTVASCVVFDSEGPVRGQYRRYNIAGIEPGDDYAAMHQAIDRRFRRAVESRRDA
jgi:excinuclease ABC subunit C